MGAGASTPNAPLVDWPAERIAAWVRDAGDAFVPYADACVVQGVDGLLAAAYPGAGGAFGYGAFPFGKFEDNLNPPASPWARSAMTDGYAPDPDDVWYAESPLPFGEFHDRNALKEWFRGVSGGRDPAPWRPLADTRWGDVIDILVNTAAADDDEVEATPSVSPAL